MPGRKSRRGQSGRGESNGSQRKGQQRTSLWQRGRSRCLRWRPEQPSGSRTVEGRTEVGRCGSHRSDRPRRIKHQSLLRLELSRRRRKWRTWYVPEQLGKDARLVRTCQGARCSTRPRRDVPWRPAPGTDSTGRKEQGDSRPCHASRLAKIDTGLSLQLRQSPCPLSLCLEPGLNPCPCPVQLPCTSFATSG